MKTPNDWSLVRKDDGFVKPKLQENRIFHALTAAYGQTQQGELYGATEIIVKREKELCELALKELRRLSDEKATGEGTLGLIIDHYQNRYKVALEKESRINGLSEDSRKLVEEYKKKTAELAEVKRNLMESQAKLRDLAKQTDMLSKKEEELRFIESNLRTEIENNKRNIINGLYEIVVDLPEAGAGRKEPELEGPSEEGETEPAPATPEPTLAAVASQIAAVEDRVMRSDPIFTEGETHPVSGPDQVESLLARCAVLRGFEPAKSECARSSVKTASGEIVSEFFYLPGMPKGERRYVFNALYALNHLLFLRSRQVEESYFQQRLELIFTDLLQRLEANSHIALEGGLRTALHEGGIRQMLQTDKERRPEAFLDWSEAGLRALEGLALRRSSSLIAQLEGRGGPI